MLLCYCGQCSKSKLDERSRFNSGEGRGVNSVTVTVMRRLEKDLAKNERELRKERQKLEELRKQ